MIHVYTRETTKKIPEFSIKTENLEKNKNNNNKIRFNLYLQHYFWISKNKGKEMAKNIKEIMTALNEVLTTTVWVNGNRQIVSLADELHIGKNNAPRSIEDLSRASLIGAYVSLQIRTDNFDVSAESLETKDLVQKVKSMVFSEAKQVLDAEKSNQTVAMAA